MAVKIFIPFYFVTKKFPWSKFEIAYHNEYGKLKVLDGKYKQQSVAQARADQLNAEVARLKGEAYVR